MEGWQSSGQSQRVYCQEQDISYSNFKYWRKKWKQREQQSQAEEHRAEGRFTELVSGVPALEEATRLEFPNGVVLKVGSGITFSQVETLIKLF